MSVNLHKILLFLLFITARLAAQETEIERLMGSELKMTFPSIYFKNNSTEYATMPYTVDSCFKHIAAHRKDIRSYVIWRDTLETDELVNERIRKLKAGLNKFIPAANIRIQSMGQRQKISRATIDKAQGYDQRQYLLSLNSVMDISKTRIPPVKSAQQQNHIERPRLWCFGCWITCFHVVERHKMKRARKLARSKKK